MEKNETRIDICTILDPDTNERVTISWDTTDHDLYCGDLRVEDGYDFRTRLEAEDFCCWVYDEYDIEWIDD